VTWAVDVTVVASSGLVLDGGGIDSNTSCLLFRGSVDIVVVLEFSLTYRWGLDLRNSFFFFYPRRENPPKDIY
jgi:hypothetical protein